MRELLDAERDLELLLLFTLLFIYTLLFIS